jgi:hypothetical protein
MNQALFSSKRGRLPAGAAASSLLWVSRTLLGLLVSYPMLSTLVATNIASGPDRDAVLFRPGSLLLLEALRIGMPWLGSALKTALLIAAIGALTELVPLACAFDLLREEERFFSARVARAMQCLPRFLALGALALITQVALLLSASLLAAASKSALQSADERIVSCAPVALFALALLASSWVNGVLDLARAACVDQDRDARSALLRALTILRERPFDVLSGSYASAAAAGFAYLTAAWLVTKIDLTQPLGSRIALCFAVHQVAVLFGIAWRVRWLSRTLDLNAELGESARD